MEHIKFIATILLLFLLFPVIFNLFIWIEKNTCEILNTCTQTVIYYK